MLAMRTLLLFLVVEFAIMSSPHASEKPFGFKDTPGKLPKEVVPTDYSVRIIPDIDKLTFAGTETVKLDVRSRVRQLVLNALELKIEAASIDGRNCRLSQLRLTRKTNCLRLRYRQSLRPGSTHSRFVSGVR